MTEYAFLVPFAVACITGLMAGYKSRDYSGCFAIAIYGVAMFFTGKLIV